jgi:hypothetical protein
VTEGAEEIWALSQEMAKLELGMASRGLSDLLQMVAAVCATFFTMLTL